MGTDDGSTLRKFTMCGVTGADLHASAGVACSSSNNYTQSDINIYGFKFDTLCQEFRSGNKWGNNPDAQGVFVHTFVWNSLTTDYKHTRDDQFHALKEEATAAYCHKSMALKQRGENCGPPWGRGSSTSVGQQTCAAALQASHTADECQNAKKADVDSCFHHCAGRFILEEDAMMSRPEFVVAGLADSQHVQSLVSTVVIATVMGVWFPIVLLCGCARLTN